MPRRFAVRLAGPEHVYLTETGFDGENIPVQIHVVGHGGIVDVLREVRGDFGCLLGQFLGVVDQGLVTPAILVLGGLPGVVQVAKVGKQRTGEVGSSAMKHAIPWASSMPACSLRR